MEKTIEKIEKRPKFDQNQLKMILILLQLSKETNPELAYYDFRGYDVAQISQNIGWSISQVRNVLNQLKYEKNFQGEPVIIEKWHKRKVYYFPNVTGFVWHEDRITKLIELFENRLRGVEHGRKEGRPTDLVEQSGRVDQEHGQRDPDLDP